MKIFGNKILEACRPTRLPFNRRKTTREQDTQARFFTTLTLTRLPWYKLTNVNLMYSERCT